MVKGVFVLLFFSNVKRVSLSPCHCASSRKKKNFSNEEQSIKLCTDASFVKTVAAGQYFMTKDAE